jgi:hypothetical protein
VLVGVRLPRHRSRRRTAGPRGTAAVREGCRARRVHPRRRPGPPAADRPAVTTPRLRRGCPAGGRGARCPACQGWNGHLWSPAGTWGVDHGGWARGRPTASAGPTPGSIRGCGRACVLRPRGGASASLVPGPGPSCGGSGVLCSHPTPARSQPSPAPARAWSMTGLRAGLPPPCREAASWREDSAGSESPTVLPVLPVSPSLGVVVPGMGLAGGGLRNLGSRSAVVSRATRRQVRASARDDAGEPAAEPPRRRPAAEPPRRRPPADRQTTSRSARRTYAAQTG